MSRIRLFIAMLILVVGNMTASADTCLTGASTQVSSITSGDYYVIKGYDQCSNLKYYLYDNGTKVTSAELSTGSTDANKFVWQITGDATNGYTLRNLSTGNYMSLGTSNGSTISVSSTSQTNMIYFDSSNYATIYNSTSGQAVDFAYDGTSPTTWSGSSTPDGSRRLLIYEAEMGEPTSEPLSTEYVGSWYIQETTTGKFVATGLGRWTTELSLQDSPTGTITIAAATDGYTLVYGSRTNNFGDNGSQMYIDVTNSSNYTITGGVDAAQFSCGSSVITIISDGTYGTSGFLHLTSGTAATFKLMSEAEYQAYLGSLHQTTINVYAKDDITTKSKVLATATLSGNSGTVIDLPTTIAPVGVALYKSDGTALGSTYTVDEDISSVDVYYEQTYFMESSSYAAAHWYMAIQNPNGTHAFWNYSASGSPNVVTSTTVPTTDNLTNAQWCFVGNPYDGYTIYNNAAGSSVTLGGSAPYTLASSNSTKWKMYASTESGDGFCFSSDGSNYINLQSSQLNTWSGADGGSKTVIADALVTFDVYAESDITTKANKMATASFEGVSGTTVTIPTSAKPYGVRLFTTDGTEIGDTYTLEAGSQSIDVYYQPKFFKESTSYATANWYALQQHSSTQYYWYYDSSNSTSNIPNSTTSPTASNLTQYEWCFVGDPWNGYAIYNNAAGNGYAFTNGTYYTMVSGSTTKWKLYASNVTTSGFCLKTTDGTGYPNYQSGYLKTWGEADAGSTTLAIDVADIEGQMAIEEVRATYSTLTEYSSISGGSRPSGVSDLTLWYDAPGTKGGGTNHTNWMEYGLPIGNGQLGATLQNGVYRDEIQFNEKSLWVGTSSLQASGSHGAYRNFGSLWVTDQTSSRTVTNYTRFLDIQNALEGVDYTSNGTNFSRRYFTSFPANVIAAKYTADGTEKLNLKFQVVPGEGLNCGGVTYANNGATFEGKLDVVSYFSQFKVVSSDGQITTGDNYILVNDASDVTVYLTGGTNYDGSKSATTFITGNDGWKNSLQSNIVNAETNGWDALISEQNSDYRSFFDRVNLDLKLTTPTSTTKALIDGYYSSTSGADLNVTNDNKYLEMLYFQYGRYLEICSSRGIDIPSNLQGIWNDVKYGPWASDIHTNINVQMNYWPAETTNLSEMQVPFVNWIKNISKSAGATALASNNGLRGWGMNTEGNAFGGSSTWMGDRYMGVNAWFVSHIWQHYRYTQDESVLADCFPAMWGAVQWWLDRLYYNSSDDTYEAPNEYSPENGSVENATAHAQQLVMELFNDVEQTIDILGGSEAMIISGQITQTDYDDFVLKHGKLDTGLRTETYNGDYSAGSLASGSSLLKEWKYSAYTNGEDGHRHLSHLMCLYPFNQVAADDTDKTYYNAAVNSLTLRGDAATGWSLGWKVNCWARAQDGDHAHKIIFRALKHAASYGTDQSAGGVYYNLWDSHAPFQIDGNFGTCSGIAEMLLQSCSGRIQILPALPSVWTEGSISGLKAVGNFEVSTDWESSKATHTSIKSNKGKSLYMVSTTAADMSSAAVTVNGKKVSVARQTDGSYLVPTSAAGDVIEIYYNGKVPYDVNMSGETNVADAAAIVDILNGNTSSPSYDYDAADVDGNSKIETTDVDVLVNKLVKK